MLSLPHLRAAAALALATLSPSVTLAEPPDPPRAVAKPSAEPARVLYLMGGAATVLDSGHGAIGGAAGSLRMHLPFGHHLALELMATTGYAIGRGQPDEAWGRLGLGLRAEASDRAWSPFAAYRLVHIHYAPETVWEHHFGDALAGSSSVGLSHRSGMAFATGVRFDVPSTDRRLRFVIEVEGSWVPIGPGPEWFVTSEAGFGYAF